MVPKRASGYARLPGNLRAELGQGSSHLQPQTKCIFCKGQNLSLNLCLESLRLRLKCGESIIPSI